MTAVTCATESRPTIIAGCGYLGRALASLLLAEGRRVLGICHRESSRGKLVAEGIPAAVCDLSSVEASRALAESVGPAAAVVHCASAGRGGGGEAYRAVYLRGVRNLLDVWPDAGRFIFVSSTSVYAQTDGEIVTEDSPAEPIRETGRILRAAEDEALGAGGCVVRMAGLYGPGRSVLLEHFAEGRAVIDVRREPLATPDGRWVNQIHRDDAAAALHHLLTKVVSARVRSAIFNLTDSSPMLQRTIYSELARRFQRPMPPEAEPDVDRKRGWTHKRVSAARLRDTGWSPRYASWFDALDGGLVQRIVVSSIVHEWTGPETPLKSLFRRRRR